MRDLKGAFQLCLELPGYAHPYRLLSDLRWFEFTDWKTHFALENEPEGLAQIDMPASLAVLQRLKDHQRVQAI